MAWRQLAAGNVNGNGNLAVQPALSWRRQMWLAKARYSQLAWQYGNGWRIMARLAVAVWPASSMAFSAGSQLWHGHQRNWPAWLAHRLATWRLS
jgi:hypothetical protein